MHIMLDCRRFGFSGVRLGSFALLVAPLPRHHRSGFGYFGASVLPPVAAGLNATFRLGNTNFPFLLFRKPVVPLPWHHRGSSSTSSGSSHNLLAAVSNVFLWGRQRGSLRSHHRQRSLSWLNRAPNLSFKRTQPALAGFILSVLRFLVSIKRPVAGRVA